MLFVAASTAAEAPTAGGLWIHHDEWEFAPPEVNEDGDIRKSASAAVANFCADGRLRIVTGVIYQSLKSPEVVIGASDGLKIYAGLWAQDGAKVHAEYRLVDSEIGGPGTDSQLEVAKVSEATLRGGRLSFPFRAVSGQFWNLKFVAAARYEKRVLDEFVECTK
jgi:hypothetical protein